MRRKTHFKMAATRNYCKTELVSSCAFTAVVVVFSAIIDFGGFFIDSRENVLPLPYYILGLPVDGRFSINLLINFAFQLFSQVNVLIFFVAYTPMTAIFMNNVCWMCDLTLFSIRDLENSFEEAEFVMISEIRDNSSGEVVSAESFDEKLKKVVDATYDIIEWQKKAHKLLTFSFLADFSLLSVVLCLSASSITSGFSDLVTAIPAFFVSTSQLFVYCWLGSRIENRYETLAKTLFGLNWERLRGHQRRDIQLVMLMCQNLKGFNGIFKAVDLATFQKVFKRFV